MINLIIHLLSNVKPAMFFVLLRSASNSFTSFSAQYTLTCSNLTIETQEKDVKYVQSYQ